MNIPTPIVLVEEWLIVYKQTMRTLWLYYCIKFYVSMFVSKLPTLNMHFSMWYIYALTNYDNIVATQLSMSLLYLYPCTKCAVCQCSLCWITWTCLSLLFLLWCKSALFTDIQIMGSVVRFYCCTKLCISNLYMSLSSLLVSNHWTLPLLCIKAFRLLSCMNSHFNVWARSCFFLWFSKKEMFTYFLPITKCYH